MYGFAQGGKLVDLAATEAPAGVSAASWETLMELETGTGCAKSSSSSSVGFRTELIHDGAATAASGCGGGLPRPLPIPVPLGPTTILPPGLPRPRPSTCQPARTGPRGPLPLGGMGPLGPLPAIMPGGGGMARPRPLALPLPRIPTRGGIIPTGMGSLPLGLGGGGRRGGPALPPRRMGPLGSGRPDPHRGQQGEVILGSLPDRPPDEGARPSLELFGEILHANTRRY